MSENASCPLDLAQVGLQLGVLPAHYQDLAFGQIPQGVLEDGSGLGDPQHFGHLGYVDGVGLEPLASRHHFDHPVVDLDSVRVEPVLLLELSVDEVEDAGVFLRDLSEQPLEDGTGALDASRRVGVAGDELGDVGEPDFVETGPLEVGEGELEHPEGLLEVGVVPQEVRVVQQHQRRQAALLLAPLEGTLHRLEVTQVYLQVDVQLPQGRVPL